MSWLLVICLLGLQFLPVRSATACGSIRSYIEKSTEAVPTIAAALAFDCLTEVPINATDAVAWLESIKPYLDWQTTLSYLKTQQPEFSTETRDVRGAIDWMIENVHVYQNEYDFEWALYKIIQGTGDGHFRYIPNLLGSVFQFGRSVALVSVSPDGISPPRPYIYSDILLSTANPAFIPSPVNHINGVEATEYISNLGQHGTLHDPDGQYNDVMYNLPQIAMGGLGNGAGLFAGGGRGGLVFPDDTTNIILDNGTTVTSSNLARVLRDFVNVTNGQDVYDRYLFSQTTGKLSATSTFNGIPQQIAAPGYPQPVLGLPNNFIRGFHLNDSGYQDVAVLAISKFQGQDIEQEWEDVAFDFITQSRAAGKTRLIIDLRSNGGGTLFHAYSLFTTLFPDLVPYGATRFRAHEAFNMIGQIASKVASRTSYPWDFTDLTPLEGRLLYSLAGGPFDYRADVDDNYTAFTSWEQKYGPHQFNGDEFSSIMRWNLSDPTTQRINGFAVNGYLDRANSVTSRPYAAEDIIMLFDGYCSSTCAILHEFMTKQANVKTVVVGGTPNPQSMMQAVGGTKGVNTWTWNFVYGAINSSLSVAQQEQLGTDGTAEPYSVLPFARSADASGALNVRDGIRYGDASQTPLQFIRDPADCRIWYEPSFTVDVTPLWKRVADVTWGNASCMSTAGSGARKRYEKVVPGKRHQRRAMAAEEISALKQGINLFTDFRDLKLTGDAEMLP
jgi:hypothetical protein